MYIALIYTQCTFPITFFIMPLALDNFTHCDIELCTFINKEMPFFISLESQLIQNVKGIILWQHNSKQVLCNWNNSMYITFFFITNFSMTNTAWGKLESPDGRTQGGAGGAGGDWEQQLKYFYSNENIVIIYKLY